MQNRNFFRIESNASQSKTLTDRCCTNAYAVESRNLAEKTRAPSKIDCCLSTSARSKHRRKFRRRTCWDTRQTHGAARRHDPLDQTLEASMGRWTCRCFCIFPSVYPTATSPRPRRDHFAHHLHTNTLSRNAKHKRPKKNLIECAQCYHPRCKKPWPKRQPLDLQMKYARLSSALAILHSRLQNAVLANANMEKTNHTTKID